jgi:hypothetical protein
MFWKQGPIQAPAGFETAVNYQLVNRRPLYVGRYDQVHFVSFAPLLVNVSAEASCQEGVPVKLAIDVRLEIARDRDLAEVLQGAGDSTYASIAQVSAQAVAARHNLPPALKAALQTFLREMPFFALAQQQAVRGQLGKKVAGECARAKLLGELVSCEVVPVLPESEVLADLAARARKDETLRPIAEHFAEVLRQKELVQATIERARAEGERARVEAQQEMEETRANLKIVQLEQEDRIAQRQAELQDEEAARQKKAQERNAQIKETNAQYEHAYKKRRLEGEMELARQEAELARVKEALQDAVRERKRLDLQVEIERARLLAEIRAGERARGLSAVADVVDRLKEVPAADYHGVTTLITSGADSRDQLVRFLLTTLARFLDGPPAREEEEQAGAEVLSAGPSPQRSR